MTRATRKKRTLRKRDVEKLENTSVAAVAIGPSDQCTCANLSCADVSNCTVSCDGVSLGPLDAR